MIKSTRVYILAAMLTPGMAMASGYECSQAPRKADFTDAPVRVHVAPNKPTEVAFPEESLEGMRPDTPEGLIINQTKIDSKLIFSTESDIYHGLVLVHGKSGRTYLLKILARPECADTQVQLVDKKMLRPSQNGSDPATGPQRKGLIDFLVAHAPIEEMPSQYHEQLFKSSKEERKVFEMGSVSFYIYKQYVSEDFVGSIFEIENTGRTAFKVDIQNIDYSHPTIREVFGKVRAVAMNPFSHILSPAPEFVSDLYSSDSGRGYLYIVSEK